MHLHMTVQSVRTVQTSMYRVRTTIVYSTYTQQDDGCVTVFYLDYGNYRVGVVRAELRVLLPQFVELPPLAIHCTLPITAITWVRKAVRYR